MQEIACNYQLEDSSSHQLVPLTHHHSGSSNAPVLCSTIAFALSAAALARLAASNNALTGPVPRNNLRLSFSSTSTIASSPEPAPPGALQSGGYTSSSSGSRSRSPECSMYSSSPASDPLPWVGVVEFRNTADHG